MTSDAERLAELEARLCLVEDERGVVDTLRRFMHTMDAGDSDGWADCFAEDATYEVRVASHNAGEDRSSRTVGRAALRDFAAARRPSAKAVARHLVVEPEVAINGDEARATSYFARLELFLGDPAPQAPFVRSFGRYVDQLRREADGRWRITSRVAEVDALARSEGAPALPG